jgi:sulfatase maturation enzyme AslB (radical SAM superfamily)
MRGVNKCKALKGEAKSISPFKKGPCCRVSEFSARRLPKECYLCDEEERQGRKSLREKINLICSVGDSGLRYLDLAPTNICNLTCRTCSSKYSSSWNSLDKELKREAYPLKSVTQSDLTESLKTPLFFKFTGGEPFLNPHHYETLDRLSRRSDAKNITITYVTNATKIPSTQVVAKWRAFKKVQINISIDGPPQLNSYVRIGTTPDTVSSFIESIKTLDSPVEILSHTTVSIYNFNKLAETHEYITAQGIDKSSYTLLTDPPYLSVSILSLEDRKSLLEALMNRKVIEYEWERAALAALASKKYVGGLEEFFIFNDYLDTHCQFLLADCNPELSTLLERYK